MSAGEVFDCLKNFLAFCLERIKGLCKSLRNKDKIQVDRLGKQDSAVEEDWVLYQDQVGDDIQSSGSREYIASPRDSTLNIPRRPPSKFAFIPVKTPLKVRPSERASLDDPKPGPESKDFINGGKPSIDRIAEV